MIDKDLERIVERCERASQKMIEAGHAMVRAECVLANAVQAHDDACAEYDAARKAVADRL